MRRRGALQRRRVAGLRDRPEPGRPQRLDEGEQAALAARVFTDPTRSPTACRLGRGRLVGKHSAAAGPHYRRIAESILAWGRSRQYGYGARDARNSTSVTGRVADDSGIEGHDAFMARLRREHGRKYTFWQLLDAE